MLLFALYPNQSFVFFLVSIFECKNLSKLKLIRILIEAVLTKMASLIFNCLLRVNSLYFINPVLELIRITIYEL